MFRYKSNFESFESKFIMSKEESTKRLIKKFNLDKTNKANKLVDVNFLADMDQVKMLNHPGVLATKSKLENSNRNANSPLLISNQLSSTSTSASTLIKSLKGSVTPTNNHNHTNHNEEYFNVYYNSNDIKYPYIVSNSSITNPEFIPQRPKTASRTNVDNVVSHVNKSVFLNNDFLNNNTDNHLSSYSNFDFSTPLTNRKREEEQIRANRNDTKIVTITHRLSGFKIHNPKIHKRSNPEANNSFNDSSLLSMNTVDDLSSQSSMSIQKLKKPDIFELNKQNSLIVKSTSNLNPNLIDFSKNENRLVNNKYHYFLSDDQEHNSNNINAKISHFSSRKNNLTFINDETIENKRPGSSKLNISSHALIKSYKNQLSTPKNASTFFLTQEPTHESATLYRNSTRKVDELSAESIKANIETISMKQMKQNIENNSRNLNALLSKKPYIKSDMFTQHQKAKLKYFKQKTAASTSNLTMPPQQNREIINKIYRAYNQNTKKFEGDPLENLLANELKMPNINGAQQPLPSILGDENKRVDKKKQFLDNVELVKENINSMHSISNYNQLIQKYKQQVNLKDSLEQNNINKIDNLLLKSKTTLDDVVTHKFNAPFVYSHNFESDIDKDIPLTITSHHKDPIILDSSFSVIDRSNSKASLSPRTSEENFMMKKKLYQNMIKESSNDSNKLNAPEIIEQIDSLASSMSKKRVSFHEKVIETDVESGNSIIKSIVNS